MILKVLKNKINFQIETAKHQITKTSKAQELLKHRNQVLLFQELALVKVVNQKLNLLKAVTKQTKKKYI